MGKVDSQSMGHGRPDDKGGLRAKEARGTARRPRVQRVCPPVVRCHAIPKAVEAIMRSGGCRTPTGPALVSTAPAKGH